MNMLSNGQSEVSEVDMKVRIREHRQLQLPKKPMKILAAPDIMLKPNCTHLMDTTLTGTRNSQKSLLALAIQDLIYIQDLTNKNGFSQTI